MDGGLRGIKWEPDLMFRMTPPVGLRCLFARFGDIAVTARHTSLVGCCPTRDYLKGESLTWFESTKGYPKRGGLMRGSLTRDYLTGEKPSGTLC